MAAVTELATAVREEGLGPVELVAADAEVAMVMVAGAVGKEAMAAAMVSVEAWGGWEPPLRTSHPAAPDATMRSDRGSEALRTCYSPQPQTTARVDTTCPPMVLSESSVHDRH